MASNSRDSTVFQTYMGRTTVRGINVDHWQSCMFWDILFSNFTLDYYFTGKYHSGKLDTLKNCDNYIFTNIIKKHICDAKICNLILIYLH